MSITELSGGLSNSVEKNVAGWRKMHERTCFEIHQIKSSVIPAQAGIQVWRGVATKMDAGLRRHDDETTAKFIGDLYVKIMRKLRAKKKSRSF
jgi:hypothetical protein